MSLLFNKRGLGDTNNELIPRRSNWQKYGSEFVTTESSLRMSGVWACLRLRSNLISSLPMKTYRDINGLPVEQIPTPFLRSPGGSDMTREEWISATQVDIDRVGNAFGIIRVRDAYGFPALVELVPYDQIHMTVSDGRIKEIRVGGKLVDKADLWHEKGLTTPGNPVGLSPIYYAANSIGAYLSAQQFALDWFGSGAHPSGTLRNTVLAQLDPDVAQHAKDRFKSAVASREIFVTGKDWEYSGEVVDAAQTAFLEEMNYGIADIARFFDVPKDMIGVDSQGKGAITYANITQRNLDFLVLHLGPAIKRRESALSNALPRPRYVKFNTDALLRMDPAGVTANLNAQVSGRLLAPSEARGYLDRAPLTEAQMAEFDRLFGTANAQSQPLTPIQGEPA